MKTGARTFGKVGMVGAAAAAALLAGSGTASAAVLAVVAVPTPGVESITTVVTVTPLVAFTGAVDCTVTATEVGDETNTVSASGPAETVLPFAPALGDITIDGLDAGLYNVGVTCDDGGTPVSTLVDLPVTVLPEGELPPVLPPIGGGGGSLPLDIFES
ncbi:hypothetical protein HQ325_14360 [Rhodococcus sp. BP-349]|uniref:hypothetical protein n=1 Tax=unclassified Rhodococcus (in: high G+C Gram-positive bacteria) TaxID=192944 RepID=UPI001C9AFC3E|nr:MULTISPECIES: hypothetical protein [unclassified Rhodococcus (in: high G+C Gram-positive bacteria)]MBY6539858.1 hypothetical protein [Rhodococcus sp. BP-363]MBY6543814.1 hypothetical protein [Rhodococcus sp. BP-369]MBY6563044.1 hypothetical protein [Rhodococcus sp. BP-370]MBY6577336.1 hypothetical protein [Rhodococcus sp. BP-364]MBY6586637.1 hypothetical protein [Rhodococcus sp. BP-358]